MQKYPDGDSRRLGPGYRNHQRNTRARVEMREHQDELAQKRGFRSYLALLFSANSAGDKAPKKPWRSAAAVGKTRAREAKRLAERAERQAANG
jgi:hypothetical protein